MRFPLALAGCCLLLSAAAPAAPPSPVLAILDRVADLERAGRDAQALALARTAVAAAVRVGDAHGQERALAAVARFLLFSDPPQALTLLGEALAIAERSSGPASYRAAYIRIQLAIHRALGGDRTGQLDAMIGAARAMAAVATSPTEREESGAALLTAAQFADSAGRRVDAERALAAGLALLSRPGTSQGADAAEAYEIAADLETRWGRYDSALTLANRAIAAWGGVGATAHPELSRALATSAEALMRLGRYAEAEPLLRRALVIADSAQPLAPHLQVLALQNLGDFYRQTGRPELAEGLLVRALAIAETMPKGFKYALDVDLDLVGLYRDMAAPERARPYAAKAAAIAAEILGKGSTERASLLLALAQVDLELGDTEHAEASAAEASAIYDRALAPGDPRHGDAAATLALVAAARGRHAEAAAGLTAAIEAMAARPAAAPELVAARKDAAEQLSLAGDRSGQPLALARAAADALATRLAEQAALPGDAALLSERERGVFAAAVGVAWRAAHPGDPR